MMTFNNNFDYVNTHNNDRLIMFLCDVHIILYYHSKRIIKYDVQ